MKRVLIFCFLLMGWIIPSVSNAQIRLGISFNIGNQPVWGPVGYDYAQYYYMPDIDVYYNVSQRQYIYLQSGRWRFSSSLPYRARNYNIYSGHKVVINEARPYLRNNYYKQHYANYKGDRSQPIIRDSRERKYFESRGHPEHKQWQREEQKRDKDGRSGNDNRKGNKNGKGKD
ncbi:MAG TPA: hypothetical protein PLK14_13695 [Sediminibacterium sp.]|nr:hypothetical protein [Sediminibacterium sp.]HQS56160.1 hypothetical protein [Sediminibacterium sp.]